MRMHTILTVIPRCANLAARAPKSFGNVAMSCAFEMSLICSGQYQTLDTPRVRARKRASPLNPIELASVHSFVNEQLAPETKSIVSAQSRIEEDLTSIAAVVHARRRG